MPRIRHATVGLALAALALAACGHSSERQAARTGSGASTSPPRQGGSATGPQGRLSPAEYRAIVTEYRQLRPLQQSRDDASALARGRRACAALHTPDTQLVLRVRKDCDNAIAFFVALQALDQAGSDCTAGSERDRIICLRNRYTRMESAIRTTTNGGVAINDELQRRAITGVCADSIGMTATQVAAYRQAEQAARDAVDAIGVGDPVGFDRATNELTAALGAGSSGDPLTGIERSCRPATPKQAKPPSKPRRRSAPKPLPSMPGGGINA